MIKRNASTRSANNYFPRYFPYEFSEQMETIKGEKWIAHPYYSNHRFSDKGRIQAPIGIEDGNFIFGLLRPSSTSGRLTARLKLMPGDSSKKYVDVLVLQCFSPCEIPDHVLITHKDSDPLNCSLENLEWDCKS